MWLTCTLLQEVTQTEKCWDEMKGILKLELCNANIDTYTSQFMEIQQKTMKLLLPISITSKQQPSDALLTMTLWQSASLLRDIEMHQPLQLKYMRTPKLWLKSSDQLKTQCSTATNSHTNVHSQYDVQ